jgi:hypothetical protein
MGQAKGGGAAERHDTVRSTPDGGGAADGPEAYELSSILTAKPESHPEKIRIPIPTSIGFACLPEGFLTRTPP